MVQLLRALGRRRVVRPLSRLGKLWHILDFQAMDDHNLTVPQTFKLWKLVRFNKVGDEVSTPWFPSAKLTIEPYHQHSGKVVSSIFYFWKGSATELQEQTQNTDSISEETCRQSA